MKQAFPIILITLFGALLRFWQLGEVPVGVTHDELGYIYNAYSIAQTSKNVFGETLPFITWMVAGGFPFLPVPIYLAAPVFWILPISAFAGRFLAALLGTIDIVLLYILVRQIFQHKPLALLSAIFLAISPWHIHFSRSAYDTNFSFFFFLLGIVLFLYEIKKGSKPIFSLSAFLLAIFSYRGMNIFFPALVLVLLLYGMKLIKMKRIQLITFLAGTCLIIFILLAVFFKYGTAYTAEANIFNNPKMQEDIDTQIREAKGPLWFRRLFLNKPMYIVDTLRDNYIRAFSPEFLFLYTEPSKIYTIWTRGRIYFLDAIFIVLGIVFLLKNHKKGAYTVIAFLLLSALPGMLGGMPYSARNLFMAAFLPILSAAGVLFFVKNQLSKGVKSLLIVVIILGYSYSVGSYLFDYYGRYAHYGAEPWNKSLKDVSFSILDDNQHEHAHVGTTSFGDFLQYAFYAQIHPTEVQDVWKMSNESIKGKIFSYKNVTFYPSCVDSIAKTDLYIVHAECNKDATPSSFIRDYQGNTVWKVYQ